jgi:molybdopterin-containing oxidoreductase family iron-sulfur binding subunit
MSIQDNERRYWQDLSEIDPSSPANAKAEDEFASDLESGEMDGQTRRHFMGIMAASTAMAGMAGCIRRPVENIMPYSKMPEDVLPGTPNKYATTTHIAGDVIGLVVESNDGRPTLIGGNVEHPTSRGGTSGFHQAMVVDLYDPKRAKTPLKGKVPATWEAAGKFLTEHFKQRAGGRGLHILSQANPSWTFKSLAERATLERYREAQWYTYEPVSNENERAGLKVAFGKPKRAVYSLNHARCILALDSDFMGVDSGSVAMTADWAELRDPDKYRGRMSRLYSVEPILSLTGSNADHRLRLSHSDVEAFAFQLAVELRKDGKSIPADLASIAEKRAAGLSEQAKTFAAAVAKDLAKSEPRVGQAYHGVVVAGPRQSALVHNLVAAINAALDAYAGPVNYFEDGSRGPKNAMDRGDNGNLVALTKALNAGQVETLVIMGANPVYTAPGDLKFAAALKKAKTIICLSDYPDETNKYAHWTIPRAHFLEVWGDTVDLQGFGAIQQPLIEPLHGSWSDIEFLARILTDEPKVDGYSQVRKYWTFQAKGRTPGLTDAKFEKMWRKWLHDGRMEKPLLGTMTTDKQTHRGAGRLIQATPMVGKASEKSLDVIFMTSYSTYDGRFANNSLLHECPDPITKLAWDNAALMSPTTARALNIPPSSQIGKTETSRVTLEVNGQAIDTAAWIVPGMADNTIAIEIGYGRDFKGYLPYHDNGLVGFDVNGLRTAKSPSIGRGGSLAKKGGMYPIACLQRFGQQTPGFGYGKRPLVREASLAQYAKDPAFAQDGDIIHCYEGMKDRPDECDDGKGGTVRGGVFQKKTVDGKEADFVVGYPGGGNRPGMGIPANSKQINDGPSQGATYLSPTDYAALIKKDPSKIDKTYSPYQWGMNIDLNRCNGCNACVIACDIENNVPMVGKDEARYGREMHWMRMDRYFVGDENDPEVVHQPISCQMCETAPCENVCPVQATAHSPEGLNDMAYNRCIGTRYCANNCPFKVRRFNFYNYTNSSSSWDGFKIRGANRIDPNKDDELFQMVRNPDVSVRFRGVMEKCTYCVQRINRGKRAAKMAGSDTQKARDIIRDISPACKDVCACNAITFGDMNDPQETPFNERRKRDRNYQLLTELNLRPRTTYLGKVRNTNPELGVKKGG